MSDGWTRNESEAEIRRARAQAHLAKRRGNGSGNGPVRVRRGPYAAVAGLAGVLGLLFGGPLAEALLGMSGQPVERVAIRGAKSLAAAEVARRSGIAADADLGEIDPEQVQRALETEPWILHARALALPGGTVVLDVHERTPAGLTTIDDTDYAVDRAGVPFVVVNAEDHAGLPRVQAEGAAPEQAEARLARAIALAERLPAYGISGRATIHVAADDDPEGFALALPGVPARIRLGEEPETRLAPLAELVAERPDAVAMASDIDLRFANQVVLRTESAREGSTHNAAARGHAKPTLGPPTG